MSNRPAQCLAAVAGAAEVAITVTGTADGTASAAIGAAQDTAASHLHEAENPPASTIESNRI